MIIVTQVIQYHKWRACDKLAIDFWTNPRTNLPPPLATRENAALVQGTMNVYVYEYLYMQMAACYKY